MGESLTIIIIPALLGLACLWLAFKILESKTTNTKKVARTAYQEGQRLVKQPLIIKTAASIDQLMKELHRQVTASAQAPSGIPDLYIAAETTNGVRYSMGNTAGTSFEVSVAFEDYHTYREGRFEVLQWTEKDGLVAYADVLNRLHRQVKESVAAVDPSCTFG